MEFKDDKIYEVRGSGRYQDTQEEVFDLANQRAVETSAMRGKGKSKMDKCPTCGMKGGIMSLSRLADDLKKLRKLKTGKGYTGSRMVGKGKSKKELIEEMDLEGGSFWDDFKEGFDYVMKPATSVAKAFIPGASPVLGLLGYGKRQKRNELVRKIMRERGVSLGEASKIIKQEKLM